jgi:hypothetical protein
VSILENFTLAPFLLHSYLLILRSLVMLLNIIDACVSLRPTVHGQFFKY